MIGARHAAGSTISNGRRQFAIKLGHPWAPSLNPLHWYSRFLPETRRFYGRIVGNRNRPAKRKKVFAGWNVSVSGGNRPAELI